MFTVSRLWGRKVSGSVPMNPRLPRLLLVAFTVLLSSCAADAPDPTNSESRAAYVPPRGTAYVSLDFAGQLLVTAPLWLGAERGERPTVYLSATPEQVTKLRENYRWIAVGTGGVKDP